MANAHDNNWMPLYVGDYLRDTGRLTTAQHGAYLLLIMDYWVNGPPPDDDRELARIARTTVHIWRRHMRDVLGTLFTRQSGFWIQKRVEIERARVKDAIGQRRAAGLASAAARRVRDGTAKPNTRSNDRSKSVRDSVRVQPESKEEGLAPYEANPVSLRPRATTTPLPSQGDGAAAARSPDSQRAEAVASAAEVLAAFDRVKDSLKRKLGTLDSQATVEPPANPRIELSARLVKANTTAGERLTGSDQLAAWEVIAKIDAIDDPAEIPPRLLAQLVAIESLGTRAEAAE